MEKVRYMISDAASIAGVESHVLRYWEDELGLTVPRNEMGHRYYTRENIQQFQRIKELKEQGYQLKQIKSLLHSEGRANNPDCAQRGVGQVRPRGVANSTPVLGGVRAVKGEAGANGETGVTGVKKEPVLQPPTLQPGQGGVQTPVAVPPIQKPPTSLTPEERMEQFRELMNDIVGRAIAQNNEVLSQNIGKQVQEKVLKEMNYLMREQEMASEERFKKLDAAIRGSVHRKRFGFSKVKTESEIEKSPKNMINNKKPSPAGQGA